MAWILLCFDVFADVRDTEGTRAMRHQNSVFHSVLKQVPWHRFDRLVDEHRADKHVRTLTTKGQLIALIYAQLSGAQSLREIEAALTSHASKLYHLGGEQVARATLSDANARRSWQVFGGLFSHLTGQVTRGLRRKAGEAVHLIDATGLPLSALSKDWAQFSTGVCGAKMHVIYDADADCPIYAAVTPANVNDITAAKAMPTAAGATYVFDLGYYDYGWWAKLDAAGCRIVTRLKINTKLSVVAERAIAKDSSILSDRIGHLLQRMARNRRNPFQEPVPGTRPRGPRAHRERQGPAHPHQRPRCSGNRNRRSLQAPLADRAVLPLGQADTQDQALPRPIRQCRAHSDRRRPHCLPAAAPGTRRPTNRPQPAWLRPPRARKPHAQTPAQSPA
jgi:hypothetical protein